MMKTKEQIGFNMRQVPKLSEEIADPYVKKTNVINTLQDSADHSVSTNGVSVKSRLGIPSILFNAATASNFKYEIEGCTEDEMNTINGRYITSEKDMFEYIKTNPRLSLKFISTSEVFSDNLDFIELKMSEVLSCALLAKVGYYDRAASSRTVDIVEKIEQKNPIGVRHPETWYKAKIKEFLFASLSGLSATEKWDGRRKLSCSYIDVNSNGETQYYRAVSDDIFLTYLYEHTYFDLPSRGANKDKAEALAKARLHNRDATEAEILEATERDGKPKEGDWGYVYQEADGKYYINVNFQIRFE